MGTGGYGCVLSPAIVFSDSVEVTQENKHRYVTKLARDAEDEYDTAILIRDQVFRSNPHISLGIFPVDNLECGISSKDLGPNAFAIIERCKQLIYTDKKSVQKITLGPKKDYKYKRGPTGIYDDVLEWKPWLRGGRIRGGESYLCALQYPKYERNFLGLINQGREWFKLGRPPSIILKYIEDTEIDCRLVLQELHKAGVVHLDIKLENICEDDLTAKLADWGLAAFLTNTESVDFAYYRYTTYNFIENGYKIYTQVNTGASKVFLFDESYLDLVLFFRNNDGFIADKPEIKIETLKFIDKICMYAVILQLYHYIFDDPRHFNLKKTQYTDLLYEDYVALRGVYTKYMK